jgi:RHS repeat-associated protein
LINGAGAVVAAYTYDPFGNVTEMAGAEAAENPWRFSTKPVEAGTGWLYYGYRWYDAETGRWPSRDPIEESGGVNLYGFVGNDGVGEYDVAGMFPYGCGFTPETTIEQPPMLQDCCGEEYDSVRQCCTSTYEVVSRKARHERMGMSLVDCVGKALGDPRIMIPLIAACGYGSGQATKPPVVRNSQWRFPGIRSAVGAAIPALIASQIATIWCLVDDCPIEE